MTYPRVVIDSAVKPGKAYLIDLSVLGLDEEGKLVVFAPEDEPVARRVEDLLVDATARGERYDEVLRSIAQFTDLAVRSGSVKP